MTKSVRNNRIKAHRIKTTDKKGIIRELILLCCAFFFLFTFFASLFSDYASYPHSFSLQAESNDSLTLIESSKQKVEPGNYSAALTPFFFKPIPVNYCDRDLLLSVTGIGPVLADSILKTRERIGLFKSQYDLLQVSGIGESRMNRFASSFSFTSK